MEAFFNQSASFLYLSVINKIFYVSAKAGGFLFIYFERALARFY